MCGPSRVVPLRALLSYHMSYCLSHCCNAVLKLLAGIGAAAVHSHMKCCEQIHFLGVSCSKFVCSMCTDLQVFCDTIKKNIKQAQSESVNMQLRAEAYLAPGVAVAAPAAAGPAAMQPSPLAAAVAAGDSLSQELTQWLAAGGGGRVLLNSSSTSSTNGSSSSPLALDSSAVSGIVGGYPLLKHAEVINSSNSVLLSESILGAPAAAPPQQYQSHGPSKSCEEVYTGSQVSVGAAIDDGFTF